MWADTIAAAITQAWNARDGTRRVITTTVVPPGAEAANVSVTLSLGATLSDLGVTDAALLAGRPAFCVRLPTREQPPLALVTALTDNGEVDVSAIMDALEVCVVRDICYGLVVDTHRLPAAVGLWCASALRALPHWWEPFSRAHAVPDVEPHARGLVVMRSPSARLYEADIALNAHEGADDPVLSVLAPGESRHDGWMHTASLMDALHLALRAHRDLPRETEVPFGVNTHSFYGTMVCYDTPNEMITFPALRLLPAAADEGITWQATLVTIALGLLGQATGAVVRIPATCGAFAYHGNPHRQFVSLSDADETRLMRTGGVDPETGAVTVWRDVAHAAPEFDVPGERRPLGADAALWSPGIPREVSAPAAALPDGVFPHVALLLDAWRWPLTEDALERAALGRTQRLTGVVLAPDQTVTVQRIQMEEKVAARVGTIETHSIVAIADYLHRGYDHGRQPLLARDMIDTVRALLEFLARAQAVRPGLLLLLAATVVDDLTAACDSAAHVLAFYAEHAATTEGEDRALIKAVQRARAAMETLLVRDDPEADIHKMFPQYHRFHHPTPTV